MFAASKTASVTGGYQISRSLRFNSADSAYLNRTPASATNQKTFTFSFWIKRTQDSGTKYVFSANSDSNASNAFGINFYPNFEVFQNSSGSAVLDLISTAVYRDVSAWYHCVIAVDTTQATSSNRALMYVNGVQVTSLSTATYPSQNTNMSVNSVIAHYIGRLGYTTTAMTNDYLTEFYFIDGQALTPSSFGQTDAQTGVWQPKAYSGSYGTNGFYLNFSDNSNTTAATLGKDYSGNGNNWTPNNFSVTAGAGNDSLVDSPTSYGTDTGVGGTVRGNYCTLNPLAKASQMTVSNGNLDCIGDANWRSVLSTFGMTTGKWYWEQSIVSGVNMFSGIAKGNMDTSSFIGYIDANGWGYYNSNGYKWNNGSGTAYGASVAAGDIVGIAFDADAGTLVFYKNGTSQGTAFSGLTSGPYFPAASSETQTVSINFGQRPFAYTAPSGFKALCTQNLPTPTIGATTATQAGKYFNTVLWTGNGSSQTITSVGFQADMVWLKSRSAAYSHQLQDVVRGFDNELSSNGTTAEFSGSANYGYINNVTSSGYGVLGGGLGPQHTNESGVTYVAWNWKANGSGSTNTSGSITSTVSANTTSGFSVVTYTGNGTGGATVGHGLGIAPSMMIIKRRSTTAAWVVYHASLGPTQGIYLNLTDAAYTGSTFWYNTAPSSSVFTLGTVSENNVNSSTYVAYCFAEVAGYSKFGSYTGNGSTDGPFVYCGFRPAFVMRKRSDSSAGGQENWWMQDIRRAPYNETGTVLGANRAYDEATFGPTNYGIDIVANGFKVRDSTPYTNASGGTYIYIAFAEFPTKFALAR